MREGPLTAGRRPHSPLAGRDTISLSVQPDRNAWQLAFAFAIARSKDSSLGHTGIKISGCCTGNTCPWKKDFGAETALCSVRTDPSAARRLGAVRAEEQPDSATPGQSGTGLTDFKEWGAAQETPASGRRTLAQRQRCAVYVRTRAMPGAWPFAGRRAA